MLSVSLPKFHTMVRAVNDELQSLLKNRYEVFRRLVNMQIGAFVWNRKLEQRLPDSYVHILGHNLDAQPPGENQYNLDAKMGQPAHPSGYVNFFTVFIDPAKAQYIWKLTPETAGTLHAEFDAAQFYSLQEKIKNAILLFKSADAAVPAEEKGYVRLSHREANMYFERDTATAKDLQELIDVINCYFCDEISLSHHSLASYLLDELFKSHNVIQVCPFRLPQGIVFGENTPLVNNIRRDCAQWLRNAKIAV